MSIITIEVAMQHVYADEADQPQVERKLASAIETAEQFIGRRIFTSALDLANAQSDALTEISIHADLVKQKSVISNPSVVDNLQLEITQEAIYSLRMIAKGIVINPEIEIGILLILGDLYANRENTTEKTANELPMGAIFHLKPFRVDMGV